jgi:hypothetical protein
MTAPEGTFDLSTKDGYLRFHETMCLRMIETARKKNADYTGKDADPFSNFARVEALGICSTEVGFLTRMTDKVCRVVSFVQKGTLLVQDETVEDTLLDLANYCLLFAGYLRQKKQKHADANYTRLAT